jgi:hypothetical protein
MWFCLLSRIKLKWECCVYLQEFMVLFVQLCQNSGSSLGYGFSRVTKPKIQSSDPSDENQVSEGTLAI